MASNKLRIGIGSILACAVLSFILVSIVRSDSNGSSLANPQLLPPNTNSKSAKRQNTRPPGIEEIKRHFPKVDYDAPEPSDPAERTKRRNKGKHFDKLGGISKEPTHYSSGLVSEWDVNLPALPVAQSSAVVVGKTLSGGAFLSSDKGAVYTELSLKIEDVLKTNDDSVTKAGLIDVSRLGGVVRYRTGEESLFHIAGQNMPTVGKRYLFFLKAMPDSPAFEIITGYELAPSGVTALDTPNQFMQYNGQNEATFLETVKAVVAGQKKPALVQNGG